MITIYKVTYRSYFIFLITIIFFSLILYLSFVFFFTNPELDTGAITETSYGTRYAIEIIINNLKNFSQYFFFFFISPLLIIIDLCNLVYQVWLGINVYGGENTFLLLYRHGIIEFPNMILYVFLSLKCMLIFYKKFNMNDVFCFIKLNYKLYIFSIVNVVLAGIIEGMITF
ncbi:hypothetical protein MPS01_12540 [Marinilactibacillus psychrotolerans]|uniref:DUF5658 domain-containing protein n=1 Tax=Marinilactibacillus psychrotolerans TaxID=191770 RepID=A0AAV3WQU7_9LACT|nr:hypothetical protein MPS01_12540 [Marinilactibacillus psychrotolerans]GEQ36244.1 hypothetical protein M132T_17520 [Marinilactibacillus psychrotolerans]SDC79808.1 hypothetical protein SAMN04488013_109105 [Marinilactibacillus psychrotolerans]